MMRKQNCFLIIFCGKIKPAPRKFPCRGTNFIPDRVGNELEQAGDLAVLVDVDALGSGHLGQTRHGHHIASQGNNKACTSGDLQSTHCHFKVLRSTQQLLVIREGILSLCHTDGTVAKSHSLQLFRLLLRVACKDNSLSPVDLLYNLI